MFFKGDLTVDNVTLNHSKLSKKAADNVVNVNFEVRT
jgi:hypothetical protein